MEILRVKKSKLHIELTPLVDVVFQLLVFFMLAASFSKPAIQMTLPKAATEDQPRIEKVVITLTKNQTIMINGSEISADKFLDTLKFYLNESQDASVHIRGDKNVPYGFFVRVMDLTRQAGAQHINLVHEQDE